MSGPKRSSVSCAGNVHRVTFACHGVRLAVGIFTANRRRRSIGKSERNANALRWKICDGWPLTDRLEWLMLKRECSRCGAEVPVAESNCSDWYFVRAKWFHFSNPNRAPLTCLDVQARVNEEWQGDLCDVCRSEIHTFIAEQPVPRSNTSVVDSLVLIRWLQDQRETFDQRSCDGGRDDLLIKLVELIDKTLATRTPGR